MCNRCGDRQDLHTALGDRHEDWNASALLRDDAYDAFDQVRDEVGASLNLAQHLLSGGLGTLLKSRIIKDVTSRCQNCEAE